MTTIALAALPVAVVVTPLTVWQAPAARDCRGATTPDRAG